MFIILRRKDEPKQLLARTSEEGLTRTTNDLQKAMLFNLRLEPAMLVTETAKVTTGEVEAEIEGHRIPAGLEGEWEIVPVDLRLA